MDRREFLKSGAAVAVAAFLPKAQQVDVSEIEADRDFWIEQCAWWKEMHDFWQEYSFRRSNTIEQIREALHAWKDAPDSEIVLWAEFYHDLFEKVVYPVSHAMNRAGHYLKSGKWVDTTDSVEQLIAERDRLKEELAFYKGLAEKPKWVWVGTAPENGKGLYQQITFYGVLDGEDVYQYEESRVVADTISLEVELAEDLSEIL